jgi:hypothetical protein
LGAALIVGLLLFSGRPLIQTASSHIGGASLDAEAFPQVGPLAISSTTTDISKLNLTGVWQDDSGNTFSVQEGPGSGAFSGLYLLSATYLTDANCPSIVGAQLFETVMYSNGSTTAPFNIDLCTSASNPIVANCGQEALWTTTFNATVTQNSITGQYLSQYWTWDTAANGAISNCKIEYNFSQDFSLTPVFSTASQSSSTTSQSSSAATPQQNAGNSNSAQGKTSSRSATNSSSTSTSTNSGASGPGGLLIVAAAAIVLVVGAVSFVVLRRKS